MALETGTYISDLVITNPTSSDPKSQGDDHLRLIKNVLKESFAGFTGAILITGTDGGAADAYTVTPATALAAYVVRNIVIFSPTATNLTTTPTINISGLGAKTIKDVAGNAVVASDLVAGCIYAAVYDGTYFRMVSVTKNYVDQLAFVASLPAQTGNSGKTITTSGTAASWTDRLLDSVMRWANGSDTTKLMAFDVSGVTTATTRTVAMPNKNGTMAMLSDIGLPAPLAVLTPTAAANVDFLSTFSATYDNYLIICDGLLPASGNPNLVFRLAVSGAADTGSSYAMASVGAAAFTTALTSISASNPVLSTGKGLNGIITVCNANDATNNKMVKSDVTHQQDATPAWTNFNAQGVYIPANAVTGGRLYWSGGQNFAAVGKVRVYGFANS